MRLTEEKIRYLAAAITVWLEEHSEVKVQAPPEELAREVAGSIRDELQREDELDLEVEKVLGRYRDQVAAGNMDVSLLRDKIKKQLARERGIVL